VTSPAAELLDGVVARPQAEIERYRELGVYVGKSIFWLLEEGRRLRPEHIAIVSDGRRVSYRELLERVERKAAGYRALGLRPLDRAVLQLPNGLAWVENFFALQRLGCVPILALPGHRAADLRYFCEHTEASAYIAARRLGGFDVAPLARELAPWLKGPRLVVLAGEKTADAFVCEAEVTAEPLAAEDLPEVPAGQIALLQLSGGSTGTPKLIPRTHDDYLYSVRRSAEVCELGPESIYLAALPVAHNFPLSSPGLLGILAVLGTVVLAPSPNPDAVFPLLRDEHVTITAAVPSLARAWLEATQARAERFPHLRVLQVGGARLEDDLARRLIEVLGCTLQQVFGMAEGLVNYTRLGDSLELLTTTQGRPMSPYDELRIVDEQDVEVSPGTAGHLQTRGPYTVRGYYRAEAHNARAFTADGFYRTGDIVRQVPSGHLVVTGRAKEQINRAGEKVAPAEVEEQLLRHDLIREAAVVGVPDKLVGERVVAFLRIDSEAKLRQPEVVAFLREQGLATFKIPDRIVFLAELPKTSVGKIDKTALTLRPQ